MHARGYIKGRHAREKERAVQAILFLEASQPGRTSYRLVLGVYIPLSLVSVVVSLSRLF
jgi:hypothetical protein